ncbi:50S ribosomal protein L24 [bacterium (Candidatus Moisslbacteria) CG12_big_fil_rev_8_21_14_0_65_36_11]|nr:50S ribosomal protein L24 [Candidatus Kuenenbacteria bacterium]OIP76363.1 MAG: 50S ribosomal protein L24 [Parcubacteria group bacterium CG2_30_36_38]PIV45998.1 MAG: 50S ribosomal protein L24 [bacterium (Candidatus Moisslbacteria) CG02_land_8_20_14_3_00_36_53]PIW68136.1 MAG: 50S ribosomal protein L24 [bacterium (Candidatus Moisslbacteria) CG12_big_fil_rev_8_21_14_0_65_36_11]PIZ90471.1 MAG: 50S ribosomal protein L24 [bacterium (Candidatus Moisslbacteria) CG_4_10_14_0_2_um_filter_36_61]PJC0089
MIKKNDLVQIITGDDKGKRGRVLRIFPKINKVLIENLNLAIKHVRPRREGEKGQKIKVPMPIETSNLMLVCPKCNQTTRISYRILANGEKHRECKKCRELI